MTGPSAGAGSDPAVPSVSRCHRRDAIEKKRKRLEDAEASRAGARARLADRGAQRSSLEARVAELLRMQQVWPPVQQRKDHIRPQIHARSSMIYTSAEQLKEKCSCACSGAPAVLVKASCP